MLLSNTTTSCHNDDISLQIIQYVSMVACILSSIGSFIIILSYLLIRPIRTKVREILVHLSVMDLTYSLANLFGLLMNYDNHIREMPRSCEPKLTHPYDIICKVQGGVAFYATISSLLWTSGIAVYLYFRVVVNKDKVIKVVVLLLYITCWGIPITLTIWVLLVNAIGYDYYSSGGWCALKQSSQSSHLGDVVIVIFNNDLWIILTTILVVMLCGFIHFHIKKQVSGWVGIVELKPCSIGFA